MFNELPNIQLRGAHRERECPPTSFKKGAAQKGCLILGLEGSYSEMQLENCHFSRGYNFWSKDLILILKFLLVYICVYQKLVFVQNLSKRFGSWVVGSWKVPIFELCRSNCIKLYQIKKNIYQKIYFFISNQVEEWVVEFWGEKKCIAFIHLYISILYCNLYFCNILVSIPVSGVYYPICWCPVFTV